MSGSTWLDYFGIYRGVQLHFKSKRFNYLKYNNKNLINRYKYVPEKHKWTFEKLRKMFPTIKEYEDFLIYSFSRYDVTYETQLTNEDVFVSSFNAYRKRNLDKLFYFKQDVTKLNNDTLKNPQSLIYSYLREDIELDTLTILLSILYPNLTKNDFDIFSVTILEKIEKYKLFLNFDKKQYFDTLYNTLQEKKQYDKSY